MRKPHFDKYWHSAFAEEAMIGLFQLVNKVYTQSQLFVPEIEAIENLIAVATYTGREREIHPGRNADGKLRLARTISDSINDPVWRRLWREFKAAREVEIGGCLSSLGVHSPIVETETKS